MVQIGSTVAQRRKELRLSQRELAEMVQVHQTMISAYENDAKLPTLSALVRLQDALGVALIPAPAPMQANAEQAP